MKPKTPLARNLRYFRKKEGLSQSDIANMFGYESTTIQEWETDKAQPSRDEVFELADLFEVRACDLFTHHFTKRDVQLEKEGFTPKRVTPKKGDLYYFINDRGQIDSWIYTDDEGDKWRFSHSTSKLFLDKEECEYYHCYLKRKDELRLPYAEYCRAPYYIGYDRKEFKLTLVRHTHAISGSLAFIDPSSAWELVHEFGEEFVMAWEFNVYPSDVIRPRGVSR